VISSKANDELLRQLEQAQQTNPQLEIPVIVTTTSGADPAILAQKGLKIHHTFESISAVSGKIVAAEVSGLAQLDQVKRIEYDGEVFAL